MKNLCFAVLTFVFTCVSVSSWAYLPKDFAKNKKQPQSLELRETCNPGTAKVEIRINNVRAMLLNSGDVWWDTDQARYIVPNVQAGSSQKPVSSIFAAAVWIAGKTSGSLKGAVKTFGSSSNKHDWKPGPLNSQTGEVTIQECSQWDRFFEVTKEEIDLHKRRYANAVNTGAEYSESQIPLNLRGWPAFGNPYFKSIYNWDLPVTSAALAPYWDNPNGNTVGYYDPADGDYPIIEVRGVGGACEKSEDYQASPPYGDQMFFWIYNDNGGQHTEFNGEPIKMEVQVQAYAFKTTDALNNMTFMRYKLVNRAPVNIEECSFGWWVDSDLGCPDDDFIGCDTARSLVYYYNEDGTDGNTGPNNTNCSSGSSTIATYGTKVPIIGIDYFEGPTIDSDTGLIDIGMTSFTYYNNSSSISQMNDPTTLQEAYNYMNGLWRNGDPFTVGGNGFNTGGAVTKFPFPSDPCDPDGWSMANAKLGKEDRRTVQSTGPLLLQPGKVNYLVIGVPWVPDQSYTGPNSCPSLEDLRAADDICQGLFDNCFQLFDGPDAPDVDVVELDQKVILLLSNDSLTSNNYFLNYKGFNPGISAGKDDSSLFVFEGYQIYQLQNGTESALANLDDVSQARLIGQVDLKNNVTTLYNWSPIDNPHNSGMSEEKLWVPKQMVLGNNKGIRNTFEITADQFSVGDQRLKNHKKYYYTAVAYAYNNKRPINEKGEGNKITFARGRNNGLVYQAIPRPIVDRKLNSDYGDGAIITRLDGEGVNSTFLDLADGERERLFSLGMGNADKRTITYKEKGGPLQVKVYNPIDVVDGNLIVTVRDSSPTNNVLDIDKAWWSLKEESGKVLIEYEKFDVFNERLIADYGISIFFFNNEPGDDRDDINGYMGQEAEYTDATQARWLSFLTDGMEFEQPALSQIFKEAVNWISYNDKPGALPSPDPKNVFESNPFFPAFLALKDDDQFSTTNFFQPMPVSSNQKTNVISRTGLRNLNNVDIVFTDDKSKWSRCIVVEGSNPNYYTNGYPTEGNAQHMHLRRSRSITKDVDANGNPVLHPNADSIGFSYFPGYALDVETGVRLNIFFAENSSYDPNIFGKVLEDDGLNPNLGRDMIWNPANRILLSVSGVINPSSPELYLGGGHHYVYVTNTAYNECLTLANNFRSTNIIQRSIGLAQITWAALPVPSLPLKSYAEGLIPSEVVYKVRVDNSYKVPTLVEGRTNLNNGMPQYHISITGKKHETLTSQQIATALDSISVVPNPYYAFSDYEVSPSSNVVKITNLPNKCVVTIYTLDGKFIRQFNRNENREAKNSEYRGMLHAQTTPDLEWDLRNNKGITVASGIYLIHIKSDEGERVVKWVGAMRQLEISEF